MALELVKATIPVKTPLCTAHRNCHIEICCRLKERSDTDQPVSANGQVEHRIRFNLGDPGVPHSTRLGRTGDGEGDACWIVLEEEAIEADTGKGGGGIEIGIVVEDAIATCSDDPVISVGGQDEPTWSRCIERACAQSLAERRQVGFVQYRVADPSAVKRQRVTKIDRVEILRKEYSHGKTGTAIVRSDHDIVAAHLLAPDGVVDQAVALPHALGTGIANIHGVKIAEPAETAPDWIV